MKGTRLTQEEWEILCKLSKEKAIKIIDKMKDISQPIFDSLTPTQKEILKNFNDYVFKERDIYLKQITQETLEKGFKLSDPYFHTALISLMPFVYKEYFLIGISPADIRQKYNVNGINEYFGKKNVETFLRIFNGAYITYVADIRKNSKDLCRKWLITNSKFKKSQDNLDYWDNAIKNYNDITFLKTIKRELGIHYKGIPKDFYLRILKKVRNYLRNEVGINVPRRKYERRHYDE